MLRMTTAAQSEGVHIQWGNRCIEIISNGKRLDLNAPLAHQMHSEHFEQRPLMSHHLARFSLQ
jgi:hypothetical protein